LSALEKKFLIFLNRASFNLRVCEIFCRKLARLRRVFSCALSTNTGYLLFNFIEVWSQVYPPQAGFFLRNLSKWTCRGVVHSEACPPKAGRMVTADGEKLNSVNRCLKKFSVFSVVKNQTSD
jgi:hypothetical protein